MSMNVSTEEFELLVDKGVRRIPRKLLRKMNNVAIVVEDSHPEGLHILGLYHGISLPRRTAEYTNVLPDKISIYRRAILNYVNTEEELVEQVASTVIHEIGHHFGIDDDRLHELGW